MNPFILDTDMLMPLFKGVPSVVERARQHRDRYGHLNITIITYYEMACACALMGEACE